MSPMTVSVCVAVLVAATCTSAAYTNRYNNIDLDKVLYNERLRKNALNCILSEPGTGCTPEVTELKKHIPDALQTGCASCSAKHKEGIQKTLRFLLHNRPEEYKALAAKYDPTGQYIKRYKDEAAQAGIYL